MSGGFGCAIEGHLSSQGSLQGSSGLRQLLWLPLISNKTRESGCSLKTAPLATGLLERVGLDPISPIFSGNQR